MMDKIIVSSTMKNSKLSSTIKVFFKNQNIAVIGK